MSGRWRVQVSYTQTREIGVWARDEEEAMEKAEAVVEKWDGVINAEAQSADEDA